MSSVKKERSVRTCVIDGNLFSVSKDSKQVCCSPECTKEATKRANRERYWKDTKTVLDRQKTYYANNAEKVKAYVREWQGNHPELTEGYKDTYASKETSRQKRKAYRKTHSQEIVDKMTIWRKANPERYKDSVRRAHHKANFDGLRDSALELADHKCQECGTPDDIMVHHIDGDKKNNVVENLLVVCRSCHGKEHIGRVNPLDSSETQKARRQLRKSGIYKMAIAVADGKCKSCQSPDKLIVHHIDGDPSNNMIENLAVFCNKCHTLYHRL